MKEITGITLLKLLKKKPVVILTTAYSEYAIEGYELDVVDYLLKPITFERFLKGVEKAASFIQLKRNKGSVATPISFQKEESTAKEFIFLKDGSKLLKVRLADILYIQSLKDYVRVFTKQKQIVSLQTMKSLEETLPKEMFIRIHNSTIVAFDAIEEVERDAVKIKDQYLPVSDSYKKVFKEFIDSKKI
jgi:DNA-binding LytR/AlgR family response regulator